MMLFGRGFWHSCYGLRYFGYYHIAGIIWVIVIAGLLFIFFKRRSKNISDDEIIYALKMKYVNGQITEEEYISKKKILSGK